MSCGLAGDPSHCSAEQRYAVIRISDVTAGSAVIAFHSEFLAVSRTIFVQKCKR